jgi:DedD protein
MTLRDAERFKDKIEVSLDSRQIFFLFFGGAVVACLVFVLGVMVGRRLEGREQVARKAATSTAIDPLAALDELGADEKKRLEKHDELAFPQALAGEPEERARPLGAADVAPAAPVAAEKPKASEDEAKKAAEAQAEAKKAEEAKKAADAAAEAKKAEEARKEQAAAAAKKAEDAKKAAEEAKPPQVAASAKAPAPGAASATPAAAKPSAAAADSKPDAKNKGKYTLQLSSFQDRAEADAFAAKVSAAGYKPYVIQSDVPDRGTFFRVRLGAYGSHEDAIAAKADFEAKQHIIAYVTRL